MTSAYHYPPDLFQLLVETIPRLFKSKRDVITFFRGARVADELLSDLSARVAEDGESVSKFDIVRTVLTKLNERADSTLGARREVLKRVVEFEDFSTCWDADRLAAKGLVAGIRRVVDVKDSFTRMKLEREQERQARAEESAKERQAAQRRREELEALRGELLGLFSVNDPQQRGKGLEDVLNGLFEASGMLVAESFTLRGESGGVVEQVDGAVEADGHVYLVEMKWHSDPIGVHDVTHHLSRLYHRGDVRGLFISHSAYTEGAVAACRAALQQKVVVLMTLEEIVLALERGTDLGALLKKKTQAAMTHKNPLYDPLKENDL